MTSRFRKPKSLFDLTSRKKKQLDDKLEQHFEQSIAELESCEIDPHIETNLERLRTIFGGSCDLIVRRFEVNSANPLTAAIVFFDGIVSSVIINEFIMRAAMIELSDEKELQSSPSQSLMESLAETGIVISEMSIEPKLEQVVGTMLSGDTVLFLEGSSEALTLNTRGWERRGVDEPSTESVVRGPRDGFTETMRTNTALIRRRLKDPQLRVHSYVVGKRTNTDVNILYLEDVANPKIVEEITRRIRSINTDAVLESGYIEQFIEDSHWTPFPLIQNTERPDKATANLLEGKVVIICDGTPFVLIAPAVFAQFYHSPEDYYERFLIGTLIRFIRVISMLMALLLPSLYIAFSSFHPEMIPSRLVIAMAAGRSTVPFPSIVEAFLMEVTMEILREASVRLPGPIGPTIGIVGALVVGQAAVQAGIVSPIMVIIVALTTIGSFAAPSYSAAIALRMLRFPMMIAASLFGLYGIMLLLILIIIHLCSLKSFGVPYLAPLTPMRLSDWKDTIVRSPLQWMSKRPKFMKPLDKRRVGKQSNDSTSGGDSHESN